MEINTEHPKVLKDIPQKDIWLSKEDIKDKPREAYMRIEVCDSPFDNPHYEYILGKVWRDSVNNIMFETYNGEKWWFYHLGVFPALWGVWW